MKRYIGYSVAAVAAMFLQGCIGSGGHSAPPPNHPDVVAKDGRAIVTWDMAPGVEYWIYKALGAGVTPENCASMSLCTTTLNVASPATVSGLVNHSAYSFSINGRTSGGPGGAGSIAVATTPREAGKLWNQVSDLPATPDMRAIAYGVSGAKFVAAGDGGTLFSGAVTMASDGQGVITWTTMTNPVLSITFNAVNYDAARAKFYGVGASGTVIVHTPAVPTPAWTAQTIGGVSEALNGIANNGAGLLVAVGDAGRIVYSSDGAAWTALIKGANALYGVAYGTSITSTTNGPAFVAVGAAGTLLYSLDNAETWKDDVVCRDASTASITCPASPLRGVTYGGLDVNKNGVFVAVGDGGTVLTSEDGKVWTLQSSTNISATSDLNAVTYLSGRRFVAVAEDGAVYFSNYFSDGNSSTGTIGNGAVTWNAATVTFTTPPTPRAIRAVAAGGLLDYCAVGAGGLSLYADNADPL